MTIDRFIESTEQVVTGVTSGVDGLPMPIVMAALARVLIKCIDRTQQIDRPKLLSDTKYHLTELAGSLAKGAYNIPDPRERRH